jgi:hypothetical protein
MTYLPGYWIIGFSPAACAGTLTATVKNAEMNIALSGALKLRALIIIPCRRF